MQLLSKILESHYGVNKSQAAFTRATRSNDFFRVKISFAEWLITRGEIRFLRLRLAGHSMEWNKISVWNMEEARMEWNGRLQERNGSQASIVPYQFHTRLRALHLQKNIYGCRVVIINIIAEVFHFIIYAYFNRQIAVLWLCLLRRECTHCIIVSTLQFGVLMLWLTTLAGLTFLFYFEADNLPCLTFFLPFPRKFVFAFSSPFQHNFVYTFSF